MTGSPNRPVPVCFVTNIPTPYRESFYRSLAARPEISLSVLYLGAAHNARRTWQVHPDGYQHEVLRGHVVERGERALHLTRGVGRALSAWRPTIVVVCGWDQPGLWLAARWARRHSATVWGWVESTEESGQVAGRGGDCARRLLMGSVATVVVPGLGAQMLVKRVWGARTPTLRIPNAVPAPAPGRAVPRQGRSTGLTVAFVGALTSRKNPIFAVMVAKELHRRGVLRELVVAGSGVQASAIAASASSLGARVRMLGQADAAMLEDVYADADVLLVPSTRDPAPLVLGEASARGVRLLVSPGVGGADELARRGAVVGRVDTEVDAWADECIRLAGLTCEPLASVWVDAVADEWVSELTAAAQM